MVFKQPFYLICTDMWKKSTRRMSVIIGICEWGIEITPNDSLNILLFVTIIHETYTHKI